MLLTAVVKSQCTGITFIRQLGRDSIDEDRCATLIQLDDKCLTRDDGAPCHSNCNILHTRLMRFAIQVDFEIFYPFETFEILKSHVKLKYFPLAKIIIKSMCDWTDYETAQRIRRSLSKIKHNIETFLQLHQKLLLCCYSSHSEIITTHQQWAAHSSQHKDDSAATMYPMLHHSLPKSSSCRRKSKSFITVSAIMSSSCMNQRHTPNCTDTIFCHFSSSAQ